MRAGLRNKMRSRPLNKPQNQLDFRSPGVWASRNGEGEVDTRPVFFSDTFSFPCSGFFFPCFEHLVHFAIMCASMHLLCFRGHKLQVEVTNWGSSISAKSPNTTMSDAMRAMLDTLMGTDRDIPEEERAANKKNFWDDAVPDQLSNIRAG